MKLIRPFNPIKYILYILYSLILIDVYLASNWGLTVAFLIIFLLFETIILVLRFLGTYIRLLAKSNQDNTYRIMSSISTEEIKEMGLVEGAIFSLIKDIETDNRKNG